MTDKYEFRIYRRTQRIHIFEVQVDDAQSLSLCGEVKLGATMPGHSELLSQAKKIAREHSYTCQTCAEIIAKLVPAT